MKHRNCKERHIDERYAEARKNRKHDEYSQGRCPAAAVEAFKRPLFGGLIKK